VNVKLPELADYIDLSMTITWDQFDADIKESA